jgi:hypothetical protein
MAMFKSSIGIAVLAAAAAISGCASQAEMVGAGTGAAVGAAVGGGTMSTIGGAMVGFGAGHVYDQKHR